MSVEPVSVSACHSELKCPCCLSPYLQQTDVRIFNRVEDARVTSVTKVDPLGAVMTARCPSISSENPSSRRHGLIIADIGRTRHSDGSV